jgi:hypothetical protein
MTLDAPSHHEERRLDAVRIEEIQHRSGIRRMWTVVERERNDFLGRLDPRDKVAEDLKRGGIGDLAYRDGTEC